ncbi:MAG: hypothetical protein ABI478_07690 [Propionivibrio sp.]
MFSIDTIYDLFPWLSVGAKYGLRYGELRQNRASGQWFSSQADLLILRADWHFVKEWDAHVELRNLRAKEAEDAKAGALIGIYRHVADGVKVGIGYNFTRYSDDLTELVVSVAGVVLEYCGDDVGLKTWALLAVKRWEGRASEGESRNRRCDSCAIFLLKTFNASLAPFPECEPGPFPCFHHAESVVIEGPSYRMRDHTES